MKKIVGVRFKPSGKIYDFDGGVFVLKTGDHVIVETQQGLGFGVVAASPVLSDGPTENGEEKVLRKVFRIAKEEDFEQLAKNREIEENAHHYCVKCIRELGLRMNLFSVESTFEGNKLTFYFTADGRIDFRQLVKMLVKEFSLRIEMRQVGIRNHAKMCGGVGRCGRPLCCSLFIENFGPVSIRMAKEQGLSLNPTKISGQCGRLMCCLTFENDVYAEIKKGYPKLGKTVITPEGKGKVTRHNPLKEKVAVLMSDGHEMEFDLNAISLEEKKE
jgi:cell fate regulator YaaT (PSP1 superfamily)